MVSVLQHRTAWLAGSAAEDPGIGATLIAISPEKPDHGIVATEKNKLTFPVLSDFGNKVARQFGIVFQVGAQLKEFSKNVFKNDVALRNGEDRTSFRFRQPLLS